ncbi:MAG: TraR/DksA family transcriptional regulator [Bacteroidetes bacterium]|nr:TraR/DksA family transcriptional regulator [Bacteroidota bacterium]
MASKGSKAIVKSTVEIMRERTANRSKQLKKAKANLKKAVEIRTKKLATKKAQDDKIAKLLGPKKHSAEELKAFKEIIIEKKKETMEELDTLKESMMDVTTGEYVSESSSYSLHMEQGTDAMEREKTFLFASRGSKFVNQLDDALVRIAEGTYGQCKTCQLLIPKERLIAVPTATTCAEYKNTGLPCERGRVALAKIPKG